MLVAQDEPLDQYLVTHPEDLFDKPPEAAVIDPTNPYVLMPHLLCAAREQPLSDEEVATYWPEASETVLGLEATGELRRRGPLLHHAGHEAPHRTVDIRSTGGRRFQIVIEETGELLGTVDGSRAYWQVHPGAVYLHQGEQFEVRVLDLDANVAIVTRSDPDYYTQSRDTTDIEVVIEQERRRLSADTQTCYGTVRVTNQVVAYARKHVATGEVLEIVPLDLPPVPLETRAVVVGHPADGARSGRAPPVGDPRGGPRGRTRGDRAAAAGRHVRPMGRRRRVDRVPSRHRVVCDLRVRRVRGWCRHRRTGVLLRPAMAGGDARDRVELSVCARVPLVRAVAQVRERERAAGQGGRRVAARGDAGLTTRTTGRVTREVYIAVVGPSAGTPAELAIGEAVGRGVAEAGGVLVCGGMGGVMEAAAGGCADAGGRSVGILPSDSRLDANPYLTIAVATGIGEARNAIVVRTADVVIAVHGEFGTLSEIALALKMGKPVVGIGTWELGKDGEPVDAIVRAADAKDAVSQALRLAAPL